MADIESGAFMTKLRCTITPLPTTSLPGDSSPSPNYEFPTRTTLIIDAREMGFLSFMRDERVALVGIGLAATALISGMMTLVSVVIEDNKIDHPAPKTQYITQETEDSLQLDTLDKLLNHPSFSIREVAIKILCDRAVNDPDALHELLYGITREDYDHRLQCLKALTLLLFQTNGTGTSALKALCPPLVH